MNETANRSDCITCQLQKVNCDQARPTCSRCRNANFGCIWTSPAGEDPGPSDRVRQACLPCRRRKVKCDGPTDPHDPKPVCPRCERLSLVCNWTGERLVARNSVGGESASRQRMAKRRRESPASDTRQDGLEQSAVEAQVIVAGITPALSPVQEMMSDKVEMQQILRTYFSTVHYFGFLSFVHEPTLFRLLDADKHPRDLTAVMIACTLRLTGNRSPDALARADTLFQSVLQKVQRQIYEVYGGLELMTVVLLRQYQQMKGHYSSAWMLWGNAVKMMQYLSLHAYDEVYSQPHTMRLNKLLKPEALRRLAWSVFFLDAMGDAGRHGVHTVSEEAYHIQLPCDETAFARGIEMRTECLKRPGDIAILSPTGQVPVGGPCLGISAHIIKTAIFRRRICHYKSRIKYMTGTAESMLATLAAMEIELKELMAELPADLVYIEDNLYINPERRTAFILLHALRHNCFIMLAESRLIVSGRDPSLHDKGYAWMRDRVRHAYPVASIVSDALRLGIVCDPFVGALAYTAIEVLLFDTPRLAQTDPTLDPNSYELTTAVRKLLEMIRVVGAVDDGIKHMRIEACRRIIKRGLADAVLSPEDLAICRSDKDASGEDDAEFDFRVFRWHRLEHTGRIPNAAKNPWAAEAILDIEAQPMSRAASRRPSPRPDQLDAAAVSTGSRGHGPGIFDMGGVFVSPGQANTTDQGVVPFGPDLLSYTEGNWSFEDNFGRFMDQAGYTTVHDGEAFPWLSHT